MTENSLPKFPQSCANLMVLHYKRSFINGFHRFEANLVISSPRYEENNQQWGNEDRD
jgi:hypothetical protein